MSLYRCTYNTNLSLTVEIEASDEDDASERSWQIAETFTHRLGTQTGDHRIVSVEASFDGIGADEVEPR